MWLVSGSKIGLGPRGGRGVAGAGAAGRGVEARVGGEGTLLTLSLASPEVAK